MQRSGKAADKLQEWIRVAQDCQRHDVVGAAQALQKPTAASSAVGEAAPPAIAVPAWKASEPADQRPVLPQTIGEAESVRSGDSVAAQPVQRR